MFKYIVIICVLPFLLSCEQTVDVKSGTIYVKNNSVFTSIGTVNVEPTGHSDWGVNRLDNSYLGTTTTISITDLMPCDTHWDLRAIFSDGQIRKVIGTWLSCGGSVSWDVNHF